MKEPLSGKQRTAQIAHTVLTSKLEGLDSLLQHALDTREPEKVVKDLRRRIKRTQGQRRRVEAKLKG